MAHRLSATLFLLISAYLFYKSIGTLFGTFRTDETYYLQDAWASYMGFSELRGLPPHFNRLVEFYWWVTDGNVRDSWNLRLLLLPLVLIQGWIIFRMTQAAIPLSTPLRSSISLLVAAAFILVMCAFRGYEVRPEVLPNTFILLAAYWLLFINRDLTAANYNLLVLATAGAALIIAASMSFRHTLSAGVFFLLCTFYLFQTTKGRSAFSAAIIVGAWISLTIYLNVISFDLIGGIGQANVIQHTRETRSLIERLTFGGGEWHLWAKVALLLSIMLAILSSISTRREGDGCASPTSIPLISLLGYYAFLLSFDSKPYEYVRSLEWALLMIGAGVALKNVQCSKGNRVLLVSAAVIASLSIITFTKEAIDNVDVLRNSRAALNALRESTTPSQLLQSSDLELATLATTTSSVVDQTRSRGEYCSRHPEGLAMVYLFEHHPICLEDAGSLAFAGWHGVVDLAAIDFGRIVWFGVPPDQLQSLNIDLEGFSITPNVYVRDTSPREPAPNMSH